MDVYDGGHWGVGGDRAIRQNADRLGSRRTLDMDFVGNDIRQVRYWKGGYQRQRTGPAVRQSIRGQRWQQRPLRERITQIGIDEFDCAHVVTASLSGLVKR